MGLGRSIIAELARSLAGEVIVETRPGSGTDATLVMPPDCWSDAEGTTSAPPQADDARNVELSGPTSRINIAWRSFLRNGLRRIGTAANSSGIAFLS